MNFPDSAFWWHMLATIGIEAASLIALGFAAQRFLRYAVWQRTMWRVSVLCLLLLPICDWTGIGRGAASFLFGQKPMMENPPILARPVFTPLVAEKVVISKTNHLPPTPRKTVWWPGWVWLVGTIVVLARIAVAWAFLLTLKLLGERIENRPLHRRVQQVADCVGLRRTITLLRVPQAISPMAFGIFRPTLGLPPGFESKLSMAEQEAVLAHELAHLAAKDPMWFLLTDLTTALLWWHPMMWWARRLLHGASELAADEAAALLPGGPHALAACLVTFAKEMSASGAWGWIGINGGLRSKLGKRVERLLQMSSAPKRASWGWCGVGGRLAAGIFAVPVSVLFFGALQSAHAQKQESLRGQLQQSWDSSAAALMWTAFAGSNQTPQSPTTATNPATKGTISPGSAPIALISTNAIGEARGLYEMGKLDEAKSILDKVLENDPGNRTARYYLDLVKAAIYVNQARAGKGVPMATNIANAKLLYEKGQYQAAKAILDAVIENDPTNRVAPHYLDLIREMYMRHADPDTLLTKTFRVDPDTFRTRLQMLYNLRNGISETESDPSVHVFLVGAAITNTPDLHEMTRKYFADAGVDLTPPKNVFFNDRLGVVLVRATPADLEIVQRAIEALNWTPTQVLIEAKFVELSQDDVKALGSQWYSGGVMMNNGSSGAQSVTAPSNQVSSVSANPSGIFPASGDPRGAPAMVDVLTPTQFHAAIDAIERRARADILSTPRVVTVNGRMVHVGVGYDQNGIGLDVNPIIEGDGYSIAITACPTITSDKKAWQASAHQNIWDGQTLVISKEMPNQPVGSKKRMLVFVTPRIIDPAGNFVHTNEEITKKASQPPPN